MTTDQPPFNCGDRVWLLLRPAPHRPEERHDGTVIEVDAPGLPPGIRIALDQPAMTPTCYATHRETHHA